MQIRKPSRRHFLKAALGAASVGATSLGAVWLDRGWLDGGWLSGTWRNGDTPCQDRFAPLPPVRSIVPVVGDGKYIWNDPPTDQTGYLEPRPYQLKVGMRLEGTGPATQIMATTAAPVEHPEQAITGYDLDGAGCRVALRALSREAGQVVLSAPGIVEGQVIVGAALFRLTLHKSYQGYERDRFPAEQEFPKDFRKLYMYDSPGIQTRGRDVRELAVKIAGQIDHPWDKARAYYGWVWENIRARTGPYTSVVEALRDRVGDCEERAAVFVALCRVSGIPARLVWVPNHNWAEFFLLDEQGEGHWIPAHTSAYNWFGWTGAHELVLQKGDSIYVPEKRKEYRLLADWMQWQGARPKAHYFAELTPLPPEGGAEAGPGARSKDEKGEWLVVKNHPLDKYTRV